jgi:hypothetical protein
MMMNIVQKKMKATAAKSNTSKAWFYFCTAQLFREMDVTTRILF